MSGTKVSSSNVHNSGMRYGPCQDSRNVHNLVNDKSISIIQVYNSESKMSTPNSLNGL